jgi:L-cysteine S-thiosulfotransferase
MPEHSPQAGTPLTDLAKSPNHPHRAWLSAMVLVIVPINFLLTDMAAAQPVPEQGFRIMNAGNMGNCIACHALPGQTGLVSTFGPALDKVASRYSPEELRQWVSDARKIKPNTLMPPFGTTQGTNNAVRAQSILNDEQIAHVVAALLTLK